MTNEQAIRALHYVRESFALDVDSYEALNMAIEALNFMDEYHQSNIEAYAHDMGVSLEQAERELRIEPKTSDSGSVYSEMPEVKTDRTKSGDKVANV